MNTQPLQFGRHHGKSTMPHAMKVGGQFVMAKPKSTGNADHDELVKTTQKWVSQTFFGEMLKQMRNSPFKDKMFSGGRGGEAFQEMFDQKMADKMAKGSGHKLVDAIVNRIEAQKAYGKSSQLPTRRHAKIHMTPKKNAEGMQ